MIDTVTQDRVLEAGFSEAARERAQGIRHSFESFIAQHRDEITALQILYNRPTKAPLKFEDLKALADTLQAPPHLWTESQLWQAYAALDASKVKGASRRRILTDLVSLVRYAMHQENGWCPTPSAWLPTSRHGWHSSRQLGRVLPTSSAGGSRKWPSTSPATSESRPMTSATRRSTSAAGWDECISLRGGVAEGDG